MIARLLWRCKSSSPDPLTSQLYNEQTFYRAFLRDISTCRNELLIESPFITIRRIQQLLPSLRKAVRRGIKVTINTRQPQEHDDYLRLEAEKSIALLQGIGVEMLYTGGHHRKLAIFDRRALWEGSLNILSQNDSCEIMRRIESEELTNQMIGFLGLEKFL